MARHYQPKDFLRRAPNKLLQCYLAKLGVGLELSWQHLGEADIEPIFLAYDSAPDLARSRIDTDFPAIERMATDGGIGCLIEEGNSRFHELDLAAEFAEMGGHLEMAFSVFLDHPDLFKAASRFSHADALLPHSDKRDMMPDIEPLISSDALQNLAAAISKYYRREQGRGHRCQVDHQPRGSRHYFFAYPEDYAEARLIFDENDRLDVQVQRSAFDVIFEYHREEGTLTTWVKGGRSVVRDMQRLFGRAILSAELGDPPGRGEVYNLDGLRNESFAMPLEPEDEIEQVRITKLKLRLMGKDRRVITLEAGSDNDPNAVYRLLNDVLAGGKISRELLTIQQVGLLFVFRSPDGDRGRHLRCTVSSPRSCSLKSDYYDEIAKKYLRNWGLDVSRRLEPHAPGSRQSVQRLLG